MQLQSLANAGFAHQSKLFKVFIQIYFIFLAKYFDTYFTWNATPSNVQNKGDVCNIKHKAEAYFLKLAT